MLIDKGTFVADGLTKKISMPGGCDHFVIKNLTQMATTQATGRGVQFEWTPSLADDYAIEWLKTNSTNAMNLTVVTSGGFTYFGAEPGPEAEVLGGTAISAANPAVVLITNTYTAGDRVRILNSTGMKQIAGMDFTISSVSGAGFSLLGLNAAGFAAPATALTCRRLPPLNSVEPSALFVTGVTKATSAVVSLSVAHSYVVGQLVHFSVPASFGMVELNGLTGMITAVGTYTVTVDINSSSFSTFAFPASALVPTTPLFATMAPAGQRNSYNVSSVPFHSGNFVPYLSLAAGAQSPAGSASDVMNWFAYKSV